MTSFDNLCMNCMAETSDNNICTHCGFHSDEPQMPHALPYKTLLQGRYVIGKAKKSNGEGISYIGYDTVLNIKIELREFFPQTLCERAEDSVDVRIVTGSELIYKDYLNHFLTFSRKIARMRELSAIVQIYDIFEENHTAYTVAEWQESITLRYFIERSGGSLNWNAARQLFMPVLSALSSMNANGVSHFGISPDTLHILKDGKMKLNGFCISEVRRMDTDLPPDMVPGCSAIEQYVMDFIPNEATDVYGFASTLFFALTGDLPQDALKRRSDARLLIPNSIIKNIPPHVVTALANALQVSPDKRTPTFERLRAELSAAPTVTASIEEIQAVTPKVGVYSQHQQEKDEKKGVPGFVWGIVACVTTLAIFAIIGYIWLNNSQPIQPSESSVPATAEMSSVPYNSSDLSSSYDSAIEENQIVVPNLVGQVFSAVVSVAPSEDYQVLQTEKQFSDTVPEGSIISQVPKAGEKFSKGSTIVVVVSQGSAIRTLPDISNLSLQDASKAATNAGFNPVKADAFSDTVPSGQVIGYKDLKAGEKLNYGTQVVILLSKGPLASSTSSAKQ